MIDDCQETSKHLSSYVLCFAPVKRLFRHVRTPHPPLGSEDPSGPDLDRLGRKAMTPVDDVKL